MLFGFALCAAGAVVFSVATVLLILGAPPERLAWLIPLFFCLLFGFIGIWGERQWQVWHADQRETLRGRALDNDERAAKLATPVVVPADDHTREWELAIQMFLYAGQVQGFTADSMQGVVGSDGWPKMVEFLERRHVLALYPGSRGYGWREDVTLRDALRRLRADELAPYPDGAPPTVNPPRVVAARRSAAQKGATK